MSQMTSTCDICPGEVIDRDRPDVAGDAGDEGGDMPSNTTASTVGEPAIQVLNKCHKYHRQNHCR